MQCLIKAGPVRRYHWHYCIASKVGPNQCLRIQGGGGGEGAFYNAWVNSLHCRLPWTYLLLHDSGFPPMPILSLSIAGRGGGGGGGGGSFSVAMSVQCKLRTQCFVLRRTRSKSMFSNEASSLRFDLNSGPPYAKRKAKC